MQSDFELILELVVGLITITLGVYLNRRARGNVSKSALRVFARMAFVIGAVMIILASVLLFAR